MKIEEYISSGILEAYALDQLSEPERNEVEIALSENSELRDELDRIEESLEVLAVATGTQAPGGLHEMMQELTQGPRVVPMESNPNTKILRFAVAASLVAAVIASVMAASFWTRWREAEDRLTDLLAQNFQFAENYRTVNRELKGYQDYFDVANNLDFRRIDLKGTDNAPESSAAVYWNQSTSEVYLSINQMGSLDPDQQYQLWAIIDGKPVDAGVFDYTNAVELLQMESVEKKPTAFAVTIEPAGGSNSPTLESMQVLGNV